MKKLMAVMVAGGVSLLGVPLLMATALLGAGSVPAGPATPAHLPAVMLALYVRAAATCPGLPWTVLAAIGTVESGNGTSRRPGVHSGRNPAGAEGPMQFEPLTFARYGRPVPPGGADPPNPYDSTDEVYAAARMLCADRAGDPASLASALFAYNHSTAYVRRVETVAASLAGRPGPVVANASMTAAAWALAQLGTSYRWGGEQAGVGFDCSGLVQAAWAAAGVSLPRVAAQQFAAGPLLPAGAPLQGGDLVFFGPRGGGVTHVGMVAAPGEMVDAPHAGAAARVEPFPGVVGAAWGSDVLVGATRPGGY